MSTDQFTVTYKDIPGFPGYRVGDDGSVWSCWCKINDRGIRSVIGTTWKQLSPRPKKCGHLFVSLSRDCNRAVHRLVLEAFVGPCPDGMECCHSPDRNPTNNRLENLHWGTRQSNIDDRGRDGTTCRGERSWNAILNEPLVLAIRADYAAGMTRAQIARARNLKWHTVNWVVTRRTWNHI